MNFKKNSWWQKEKSKKAFTLIELLLVVVIIAILAAFVLVSLSSARNRAKTASAKKTLSAIVPAAIICRDGGGIIRWSGDSGTAICNPNNTNAFWPKIDACGSAATDTKYTKNLTTPGDEDTWRITLSTCTNHTACIGVANAYCDKTGCYFPSAGNCK